MPSPLINFTAGPSCFLGPFMTICSSKPHKNLAELVTLLKCRGMVITDENHALRKLSQIGYYRLSGFWYPCRRPLFDVNGEYLKDPVAKTPIRDDFFQDNVKFNDIVDLYIFDKRLRLMLLDAIERVEIYVRSVIAHELGRLDPLAYQNEIYINPNVLKEKIRGESTYTIWGEWQDNCAERIRKSKDDCIQWHKKRQKEIPFWVVIECWDFGLMSKYFENLKRTYQEIICEQLQLSNIKTFRNWLTEINTLRNKCAHHSRIWNHTTSNAISLKGTENIEYFQKLDFSDAARKKLYIQISILWYLVKTIGPSSTWINNIADLIDNKPVIESCPFTSMGFADNSGFPREKFNI